MPHSKNNSTPKPSDSEVVSDAEWHAGNRTDVGATYTTKAGNLWVFELGASADLWVRQADRHRPGLHFGTTDLDGLEAHDAANPISLWFRLGEALGLKGVLTLCHNNCAPPGWMWTLCDDSKPVHLFARFDYADAELPMTVVPTLVDGSNEGQLEAILAVVEAKPDRGQAVYTYEPPEPHPAIARIDAILDRALADLEPRPEDAPRQRRTNRDLADLGRLIRALTTARRELKR